MTYQAAVKRFVRLLRTRIEPIEQTPHERGKSFSAAVGRHVDELLDGLDLSALTAKQRGELCGRLFDDLWRIANAMGELIDDVAIDLDESPEDTVKRVESHLADEEKKLDEDARYMEHHEE